MNRRLGATLLGLIAGAAGFAALLLVGWLVYQRLFGDSAVALVVIGGLFAAAGLYAAWILGMLVFSAVRGAEDGSGATV